MAGKDVSPVSQTITAATSGGQLTVGSTTGFYVSMIGWIWKSGQPSAKVKVMAVPDATHLKVQIVIDAEGTEANSSTGTQPSAGLGGNPLDNRLKPARYDYSDVSAYNDGTWAISCDQQFVYATNLSQTF